MYETNISQVDSEFSSFLSILRRENVRSVLEIGSRFGGSLWRIANTMPQRSRIVSCDSGKGMGGKKPGAAESLKACVDRLCSIGYDAHLIVGDSHLSNVVNNVRALGPFDAIFIDGDHEYSGVKRDWQNYGPSARIVAFHDIGWRKPDNYRNSKMVEVPMFWKEIKNQYRHQEFIDRSNGGNYGIGVLWRQ